MDADSIYRKVPFLICGLGLYCLKNKCLQMTHLILYMLVNSLLHQERIFFNTCILLNLSGSSVRFLLLLHFRKVYLWPIGSKNRHITLPCNADLFLLQFPCLIIVFTWTKYVVWDTFYTSTESSGLRCIIWNSTIGGKSV